MPRPITLICVTVLAVAGLVALTAPVYATHAIETAFANGGLTDEEQCNALSRTDFLKLRYAPTRVHDTSFWRKADGSPWFCQIRGQVEPDAGHVGFPDPTPSIGNVRFILRLPPDVSQWNGRFMEIGCGGTCSNMRIWADHCPVYRGYACVVSDMGNPGTVQDDMDSPGSNDGLFAVDNLRARINFGYRAAHVAALAGKAITNAYYRKRQGHSMPSIFMGCSTGGYQGMVEAQRFPWDFNGIVAIAPDMDEADLAMRKVWFFHNWVKLDGADATLLHEQVLKTCETDGSGDNRFVANPLECARQFNPAVLECKQGPKAGCLSSDKVKAAQGAYGPPMVNNRPVSTGGIFPGSEFSLDKIALGLGGLQNYYNNWAITFFGGMFRLGGSGIWNDNHPYWSIDCLETDTEKQACFDLSTDYKELGLAAIYNDTNPDLRKFQQAGGKLLLVQGGGDAAEFPWALIDYYDTVIRTMGGLPKTKQFARLFVVPGMNHCTGGEGAYAIDYLTAMESWIRGTPPQTLFGEHLVTKSNQELLWKDAMGLLFDNRYADYKVAFRRDIYPYPHKPSPR